MAECGLKKAISMKKLKQFIPNLFTLGNLFCGCLAIYFLFRHIDHSKQTPSLTHLNLYPNLLYAIGLIFLSLLLDFFDGFVARLLNATSAIGGQLDSLADVVSFGVVPGFILFSVIDSSLFRFFAFSIPLAAAYRLAKFNIDEEQTTYFKGLATPAATLFVIGIVTMAMNNSGFKEIISTPLIFIGIIALICYLMVSNIPLFSFKVNSLTWRDNWYLYIFLLISVALLVWWQLSAFVLIIPVYILLSVVAKKQFIKKN